MKGAAQIVMIADDLSGAADCAVTYAIQGLRTVVQICESPTPPVQVLSIDAATRSLPADRASAITARIAAAHADGPVLFKKLDSLLRGHVGAELAAMRHALTPAVVVMAPALPAQGRTTAGGCQWWNGQRVADGPRMLAVAGLTCSVVDLAGVRDGSATLSLTMSALARTHDVVLCDAETDQDLRTIAAAIAALPRAGWKGSVIWAGSSGLARHIPEAMGITGISDLAAEPSRFRGPILIAVGSRTAMAREQAREAGRNDGLATLLFAAETLRARSGSARWTEQDSAISRAFAAGHDAMIVLDSSDEITDDPGLCAALASFIQPHLPKIGALVATGGETARAILTASGITGLQLLKEVEPGVPLAVSIGARQLPVITKSGSFGDRATLAHCVRVLQGHKLE